jgi:hypothetical protein
MTAPALQQMMGYADGESRFVLKVTVTDAFYSNPVFYWSDVPLTFSNIAAYPVISTWGRFYEQLSQNAQTGTVTGEVTLNSSAICAPSSSVARKTVGEWTALLNFVDATVELYVWHKVTGDSAVVWKGRLRGMGAAKASKNRRDIEMLMASGPKSFDSAPISTLITKESFSNAPVSAHGSMVPRHFGHADGELFSGATRASLAWFGYPMPGCPGAVVADPGLIWIMKGSGDASAHTFTGVSAGDPNSVGDLWLYDTSMDAYGRLESVYGVTNDADKLQLGANISPTAWFFIRPSAAGSTHAAGFGGISELIDNDPTNYLESTAASASWGAICPEVSMNGTVLKIAVMLDVENAHATKSRKVRFGFWDIYKSGGAGFMTAEGLATIDYTLTPAQARTIYFSKNTLGSKTLFSDFAAHTGSATMAEYKSGRFITRSTGDTQEANIELRAQIIDLGGADAGLDLVRVRHMSLAVLVQYPQIPKPGSPNANWWWSGPNWPADKPWQNWNEKYGWMRGKTRDQAIKESNARGVGTQFFARGVFQKDDGSGTITGTASAPISIPSDVAYFLLNEAGESVNVTSGTLGSVPDARDTGTIMNGFTGTLIQFGPEEVKNQAALDILTSRFPIRTDKQDGVWNLIPDDMNPHSSRTYRSYSDPVFIGPEDISANDFEISTIPFEDIRNSVVLKCGHGFPNREASYSYAYKNPLSISYFGETEQLVIEEPFVVQSDISGTVDATPKALAEWYGRRNARPRLFISTLLTQEFYDLKPGHVVEFRDLEDIGIAPVAFRNGLVDYYFRSSLATTNFKDSTSFGTLLDGGATNKCYIGHSQLVDGFDFDVQNAATYTVSGAGDGSEAWKYLAAGGTFTQYSGTTNGNAFKSTGPQSVRWARPRNDLPVKAEVSINGVLCGPCYWSVMDYTNCTVTGHLLTRVTHGMGWAGRKFEALRVVHEVAGGYPARRVYFAEVM